MIASALLVVGVDTGLLHLAAAYAVPLVGIFRAVRSGADRAGRQRPGSDARQRAERTRRGRGHRGGGTGDGVRLLVWRKVD
jgi:ADP-heptose:LPS heptosyltransferase